MNGLYVVVILEVIVYVYIFACKYNDVYWWPSLGDSSFSIQAGNPNGIVGHVHTMCQPTLRDLF